MLERQERTALILLAGVVIALCAAHLVLESLSRPVFARPYSGDADDGDLVFLEGQVDQVRLTASGGHLILEVAGVPVFVPESVAAGIEVRENDLVRLYGLAQTYRGNREIVVRSPGDIWVLARS
ncbi:MAG: hypothetical protein KO206_01105 [Methanomicrobiaceae archaeon]|uniref:Uncharacterized protein n=1 Tax=hydrocarbon metagenome TaxID=938273 RepID=A0A0W8FEJ4_9ZZZZ|nr:hypothetical protein [Methanomicrobiaceae archaeon]MDD5419442.1 hypothetical protein [Methanomicrobiaceae archaeon]